MKLSTLCFLIDGDNILLAMKKRDFGKGKWNGVGGKVNEGESIEDAAVREIEEEIGVQVNKEDLQSVGTLRFRSETEKFNWDVRVFFVHAWQGAPSESEEMRPQWYKKDQLPFSEMWPDDKHWLPPVLAGKHIEADFEFDAEGKEFFNFTVKEV